MSPKVVVAALVALAVGLAGGLGLSRLGGGDEQPDTRSVAAGFARDMQTHHDQAVEMSWIVRDRTDDRLVRSLAYDIARTQAHQSGQMAGWLQAWGLKPTGPGDRMEWMESVGHSHGDEPGGSLNDDGTMPGMATQEQLDRLKGLRGEEAEVYYLQLMIRHHEAGVPMAKVARDYSENDAVETLANSIIESQTAETKTMTSMLEERDAEPLD